MQQVQCSRCLRLIVSMVIIAVCLGEHERTNATQHLEKHPAGSIDICLGCDAGGVPLFSLQVLTEQLWCCPPRSASAGNTTVFHILCPSVTLQQGRES